MPSVAILVYRRSDVVSGVGFQGSKGSVSSSAKTEYPVPKKVVVVVAVVVVSPLMSSSLTESLSLL